MQPNVRLLHRDFLLLRQIYSENQNKKKVKMNDGNICSFTKKEVFTKRAQKNMVAKSLAL